MNPLGLMVSVLKNFPDIGSSGPDPLVTEWSDVELFAINISPPTRTVMLLDSKNAVLF